MKTEFGKLVIGQWFYRPNDTRLWEKIIPFNDGYGFVNARMVCDTSFCLWIADGMIVEVHN